MRSEFLLYVDQYGAMIGARTLKELVAKAGPGRVSKMYRDTKEGGAVQVGYVVGSHWFEAFRPVRIPA